MQGLSVRILGCGASGGVPGIYQGWGACNPENPKNRRLRSSILIQSAQTRLLVDTSPDLRAQLLAASVRELDAVFYTHVHADHVMGLDDLRDINRVMRAPLPIYGSAETLDELRARFAYIFTGDAPTRESIFKPWLVPTAVADRVRIGDLDVHVFDQDHGYGITQGLRIGDFAYSTDVVDLPEAAFDVLAGVRLWVVGCLTDRPHPTHAHLEKVLTWAGRVQPERLVLTHMGMTLDYDATNAALQNLNPNWTCAYDGMEMSVA